MTTIRCTLGESCVFEEWGLDFRTTDTLTVSDAIAQAAVAAAPDALAIVAVTPDPVISDPAPFDAQEDADGHAG